MIDARMIENLIGDRTDADEIRSTLDRANVRYTDCSDEYGFFNLHIETDFGYVGIAKTRRSKKLRVSNFHRIEMKWSGIPTFEPSGRRSF